VDEAMTDLKVDDYQRLRRPGRKIEGISAVLLPYDREGRIDEPGFRRHLRRTLAAGLRVAVNMDTGYVDLLTSEEKQRVLAWTAETAGENGFVAGALPAPEVAGSIKAYRRQCETIAKAGGTPIIFPSPLTAAMDDSALIEFLREIARSTSRFLAFELGKVFNPNGRIFSPRVLSVLMAIPQCVGLKHSSLDRNTELQRIELRDRERPDFSIYSGNDLAADMIEYGSDYLLGLSTFAPEVFAARDRAWARGSAEYFDYRDFIQYLGWIGFRDPVPAYKHSAATFLQLTGGVDSGDPHPRAPRRESWDRDLLADAAGRLERLMPALSRSAVS
jgi:dihydrodipicolinate synthase/N-acetylneuraminate lyase